MPDLWNHKDEKRPFRSAEADWAAFLRGISRRFLLVTVIGVAIALVAGARATAADKGEPSADKREWKIGYWAWEASYISLDMKSAAGKPVDLLYAEAGEYRAPTADDRTDQVELRLPAGLPSADGYIAVLRFAEAKVPDTRIVQTLLKSYLAMKSAAQRDSRMVIGLQLDLDCPTSRLPEYARFLKALRSAFPREDTLSVTALLDWFRPGSAVADVIGVVDEFAPQFYDVAPPHYPDHGVGVARHIDPAKWDRIFNSFGRPYRIGIASFGRILGITHGKKHSACASGQGGSIDILSDPPLELLARNRLVQAAKSTSKAGETLIRFKKSSGRKIRDSFCPAYDEIKMIIPTQMSVSSAYNAAKKMGKWCRGVIFFRWPLANEAMTLGRAEVEAAITGKDAVSRHPSLESEDGLCATVACTDLYLRLKERFPDRPVTVRIRSSRGMEYFLPDPLLRPRPSGEDAIEVTIPAYAGVPRLFLGRAITRDAAEFTLEEPVK